MFEKRDKLVSEVRTATLAEQPRRTVAVNEDNGVTVGFKDLSTKGENGTTTSTIGTDANGNLRANSDVTINSKVSGDDYAAAVGHEGSHVADAQDVVNSGLSGGLLCGVSQSTLA